MARLGDALDEAQARSVELEREVDQLREGAAALRRRVAEAKEDQVGPRVAAWIGFGAWVGVVPALILGATTHNVHVALAPVLVGGLAGGAAAYFRV